MAPDFFHRLSSAASSAAAFSKGGGEEQANQPHISHGGEGAGGDGAASGGAAHQIIVSQTCQGAAQSEEGRPNKLFQDCFHGRGLLCFVCLQYTRFRLLLL